MPVCRQHSCMNRSFCRNFLGTSGFSVSGAFVSACGALVSVSLSGSLVSSSLSFCLYVDLNRCFHIRSCRTAYGNHCFFLLPFAGYHTCITDFCDCFLSLDSYFRSFVVCSIFRSDHCGQFCSFADFQFALCSFTETPVIGFSTTGLPFTFTAISAVCTSPSFTETLILVSPALTAVTLPFVIYR